MAFTVRGTGTDFFTAGANFTVPYTVNAASDLLIVVIMRRASDAGVDSVTYAGSSLTRAKLQINSVRSISTELYYKVNPATGNNNIVIDLTVAGQADFRVGILDASGVNTSSALDTTNGVEDTAQGSPSITLSNPVDDALFIAAFTSEDLNLATEPGGFNSLTNNDEGSWSTGSMYKVYVGDPGSPTVTWSGQDDDWTAIAVSFSPSAGGAPAAPEANSIGYRSMMGIGK